MPRGRPKGSKNKPKNIETITLSKVDSEIVVNAVFRICPRCASKKRGYRLNGDMWCRRCGQRWDKNYKLIPSADRRKYKGYEDDEHGEI